MNRKQIISWCLFDFANSSYSAVIAAVLFSVYYARVIVGNSAGDCKRQDGSVDRQSATDNLRGGSDQRRE